jgi:hypothetical protein
LKETVGKLLLRIQGAPDSPAADKLPLDPRISIDGQSYSQPALELPAGFRTIQVRAFGWEEFSTTVYVEENSLKELDLILTPALFKISDAGLSRRRFNPANAGLLGTTVFNFEVSAPGKGIFAVLDQEGKTVFSRSLDPFEDWSQSLVWNGKNSQGKILDDGVYTLIVRAFSAPWDDSAPVEESLALDVVLDSSRIISPLTLSSGKSGLLFAPLPSMLPSGSFQIEGSLLAGAPPESNGLWKSFPFSVAFRFSPLNVLEVSAALNVMPNIEEDTTAGGAGSVKWVFVNPHSGILGAAAGLTASWTGKTALTPFGMASGIELFFPFSVNLGKLLSLSLSPAALWTGDEGFPWKPVPRLLVSGGVMMKMTYFSAGLSIRSEFNFSDGSPWPLPFITGAEVKILPPPSSFVFSFMGGIWARDSEIRGFGGVGIGMVY